jgi:protein-tyrosine phosphatase
MVSCCATYDLAQRQVCNPEYNEVALQPFLAACNKSTPYSFYMFSLFKKNKEKSAVTSTGQLPFTLDMHSHILPGIDDGSPNVETSLMLVRGLYDLGIRTCIATPHIIGDLYRNSNETIEPALEKLQNACAAAALPVQITAAAEYMLDDYFMQLLQSDKPLRTLHKNLLLTELPYTSQPANLQEMLFHIITAGYHPVLAHPERYFYFHNNFEDYKWLKDLGFILQVNLLSLTGYYGKNVARAAKYLLDAGLAGIVGTDLHHSRHLSALQSAENQKLFNKYVQDGNMMNKELMI